MARQGTPRRDFWLSHLRKWRAQGGTMKAYAKANDLPVDNFYAAKSAYARGLTQGKCAGAMREPQVTLLPVQVAPRAQSREPVTVSLPNGVRTEVPGLVDVQQWRALLDALGHRG